MPAPLHALVAGAGIGGLTAALALARAGLRVTLLERAALLGEVGAGLQISPSANRIFAQVGVLDRIAAASVAPERLTIHNAGSGLAVMNLPLGRAAQARWGAPMLCIHRADLQRALLDAVAERPEIDLRTGFAVTGATQDGTGVRLASATGESVAGDLLIAADGVQSHLRGALGLGRTPSYSGRTAWRALVAAEAAPAFARERVSHLWLGAKSHLVHYPLRGGAYVNVVAITEEDWRPGEIERFWAESGDARRLRSSFSLWHEDARALVAVVEDWRRWPLFDSAPTRAYVKGRAALLGDAAHPMLPFFAQGASQAIEDAGALGAAFRRTQDVSRAFADYERARIARATRVQIASRRQGAIYHLSGPAALARDLAMRALPASLAMSRFDWLYGHGR